MQKPHLSIQKVIKVWDNALKLYPCENLKVPSYTRSLDQIFCRLVNNTTELALCTVQEPILSFRLYVRGRKTAVRGPDAALEAKFCGSRATFQLKNTFLKHKNEMFLLRNLIIRFLI